MALALKSLDPAHGPAIIVGAGPAGLAVGACLKQAGISCLILEQADKVGGALDAAVETVRPDGATRTIPIAEFYRLPGDTPHIETTLTSGELIGLPV